jgi:hypothetical protein
MQADLEIIAPDSRQKQPKGENNNDRMASI